MEGQARPAVLHHHERWDGCGFPAGLQGEQIPIGARILAVASGMDRFLTPMPHRPALSPGAAAHQLMERSGTVFDPTLVHLMASILREARDEKDLQELGILVPPRGGAWSDQDPWNAEIAVAEERAPLGGPIPPGPPPASRQALDRLQHHCHRLVRWAEALGVPRDVARLLVFRHEAPDGCGPQGVDWSELTPLLTGFQLELLLLDLLRHQERPLNAARLNRALGNMDHFADWAAPMKAIREFREHVSVDSLPRVVEFAEWDRVSGGVELGAERARDEALLFAYTLWADQTAIEPIQSELMAFLPAR
jgi:hypothetical protein